MTKQEIYLENRRIEINKRLDDALDEARSDIVPPPLPQYERQESGVFRRPASVWGLISQILP